MNDEVFEKGKKKNMNKERWGTGHGEMIAVYKSETGEWKDE